MLDIVVKLGLFGLAEGDLLIRARLGPGEEPDRGVDRTLVILEDPSHHHQPDDLERQRLAVGLQLPRAAEGDIAVGERPPKDHRGDRGDPLRLEPLGGLEIELDRPPRLELEGFALWPLKRMGLLELDIGPVEPGRDRPGRREVGTALAEHRDLIGRD